MSNPFVYDEPVLPARLAGRSEAVARLAARALDGRNSRLEGSRRFGKTSLLRAVLAEVERDGAHAIEVNFLGCVTAADIADRIETAYSQQLAPPLRKWLSTLARTWRPTLSVAPAGVGVQAQPQVSAPGLLDRLALPRRIHERTGRMCVIAFDEFQEVFRAAPELPGTFRSVIEGQGDAAAYLFSGSHPGLMRELFSDRRHAFFGQAAPTEVGPLSPVDLGEFVDARFAEADRDVGEALGLLLDAAEGHPQRAMLLAHHLFEQTPKRHVADVETWDRALNGARREASGELRVVWDTCSELERRILKAVANREVGLTSREAAIRFGLAKSGSTRLAVDRLVRDGTLVLDDATRSGYRVVDPLLAAWLRQP